MTTGTRSIGSEGSPFYNWKSWSGADGAVLSSYKVMRPAYYKITYKRIKTRINGRTYRFVVIASRVYIPARMTRHRKRSHSQWNNYSMGGKSAQSSPRSGGGYLLPYYGNSFPVPLTANEQVRLQSKLVNRVRGHSYNMAVSNAQIGLTLDMVASTVNRVSRSIRSLRHGNIADAARHLGVTHRGAGRVRPLSSGDLANAWLELQYGWKPLFQDVHDGAEAMAFHLNPPRTTRFSVSQTHSYSQSEHVSGLYNSYADGYTSSHIIVEQSETLTTARSLGLLDPLSVAWEVLPFSFVADWFIPIGTYLDNYNVIPVISGRFLTSTKSYVDGERFGIYSFNPGGLTRGQWTILNRTFSTNLVAARPKFEIASGSHTGHFWNSLALLRQLL